jgi:glucuronyl/N-acetylglucosaminyl transferase EXT2
MNPIRKRRAARNLVLEDGSYDVEEHISFHTHVKHRSNIRRRWKSLKIMGFFPVLIILAVFVNSKKLHAHNKQYRLFQDPPLTNTDLDELIEAKDSILEAKTKGIAPLRPIDVQKFTVRMNTWRRNDILLISVNHFRSCQNVAQIQIVWCDSENEPPQELLRMVDDYDTELAPIVIERHLVNSLNERFHVMHDAPTLGILSVDDDVLRPCSALDAGFHRWKKHPDRMVGYDFRSHSEVEEVSSNMSSESNLHTNVKWRYMLRTPTWKSNQYSITLTRFCFIHKDYLDLYMDYAPRRVLETVDIHMNCEDIAMSFFVSAVNGRIPLLVDQWAINTLVKLKSGDKISKGAKHLDLRNKCVDLFGSLMGLKDGYASIQREEKYDLEPIVHGMIRLDKKRFYGLGVETDDKPFQKNMGDFFLLKKTIHHLGILDSEPG